MDVESTIDYANLKLPSRERIQVELDRRECIDFATFAKRAWPVIEPATKLKWGWVMDGMTEHLQAVTTGDIQHLLMNVPPGTSKSTLTSVLHFAYEWGPAGLPHNRFIGTAHRLPLAIRDNVKCRRLIKSDWFQKRWPLPLMSDVDAAMKFENKKTGWRAAFPFNSITGERGDRVIVDDPLSVADGNSDPALLEAELAFTEGLHSRVNDEHSAIIVVMQRLHENDTSGIIIDRGLDYEKFIIPMEFEMDRRCSTKIGWRDPRTYEGELMFPERFPRKQVEKLKKTMGEFSTAGQLQQAPVPRGGGLFKLEWFQKISAVPVDCIFVRGWDLASTVSKSAAYTASVKIGITPDRKIIIADVFRDKMSSSGVRNKIIITTQQDGILTRQSIPQDPGQAGKAQVNQFSIDLSGYDVRFSTESGDKVTRALPLSAQAEAGNVYYVEAEWNKQFLDELSMFPNGKFKDQSDAASRAYSELLKLTKTRSQILGSGPVDASKYLDF